MTVTLEDARRVIAAGEEEATRIGQPMNVAVVDAGGNLVAHVRQDGAWIGSVDISISKAWTSRAFDIATKDLGDNAQPGGQFFGIHTTNGGRVAIFAGRDPARARRRRHRRRGRERRIRRAGSACRGGRSGGALSARKGPRGHRSARPLLAVIRRLAAPPRRVRP